MKDEIEELLPTKVMVGVGLKIPDAAYLVEPSRNFWVIGGTSGTGAATVKLLKDRGHKTFVTGEEVDVRSFHAIRMALRIIEHELAEGSLNPRRLDGVVFSAGINYLQWLGKMGAQGICEAEDVMDINYMGFIRLMDVLCSEGRDQTHPMMVVAISSDAATRPMRTSAAYCASKAALNMAVRCAARELGRFNWQINAVSPGMLSGTDMTDYVDSRVAVVRDWTQKQMHSYELNQEVVAGRIDPADVAEVVVNTLFAPPHMNGSVITFNGGR